LGFKPAFAHCLPTRQNSERGLRYDGIAALVTDSKSIQAHALGRNDTLQMCIKLSFLDWQKSYWQMDKYHGFRVYDYSTFTYLL